MPSFQSHKEAVRYYEVALANINREIEEREKRKEEIIRLLNHNKRMI